jgi:squalene-hopene/tetraprenyl-beta-curcumene cyclase
VSALAILEQSGARAKRSAALDRALYWLVAKQNPDGGWSGADGAGSSMEETGLALEGLTVVWQRLNIAPKERDTLRPAIIRGGAWLAKAIEHERWHAPAPIGLYFAKLWYYERLYPLIFATGALTRLAGLR